MYYLGTYRGIKFKLDVADTFLRGAWYYKKLLNWYPSFLEKVVHQKKNAVETVTAIKMMKQEKRSGLLRESLYQKKSEFQTIKFMVKSFYGAFIIRFFSPSTNMYAGRALKCHKRGRQEYNQKIFISCIICHIESSTKR